MTVAELITELSKLPPEFEVEAHLMSTDKNSAWGLSLNRFLIDGVCDVGFSDKVIILGLNEEQQ